ncbi:MAG: DUF1570 domain-containing protein [Planctomycetales bacterium]
MRTSISGSLLILTMLASYSASAAGPVVELRTEEESFVGRVVAHDDNELWLEQQDGNLDLLKKAEIREFKKRSESFRPLSSTDMRAKLRKELGTEYDVIGTGNYLVCGQKGTAKKFADSFEETYRTFTQYFSVRGILPHKPEFPLVAIVFPNQSEFAAYARKKDGLMGVGGIAGYYIRTSNRVALYDRDPTQTALELHPVETRDALSILESSDSNPMRMLLGGRSAFGSDAFANIESGTRDTIIHEVTHQMAFNTGVHNRIGQNPRWFVEGLATVFEAPGIRRRDPSNRVINRVNPERFAWFQTYRKARRPSKFLQTFLASDEAMMRQPLDGYAEAWALTFYLLESRSREYSAYIKKVSAREPFENYGAEERVADFRSAFGQDLNLLEAAYLRYMQDLK